VIGNPAKVQCRWRSERRGPLRSRSRRDPISVRGVEENASRTTAPRDRIGSVFRQCSRGVAPRSPEFDLGLPPLIPPGIIPLRHCAFVGFASTDCTVTAVGLPNARAGKQPGGLRDISRWLASSAPAEGAYHRTRRGVVSRPGSGRGRVHLHPTIANNPRPSLLRVPGTHIIHPRSRWQLPNSPAPLPGRKLQWDREPGGRPPSPWVGFANHRLMSVKPPA
jgi:hypothetical protein